GASQSYFDDMLQSEISVMTAAIPADTSGGGIRLNSILKDGGNQMSGQIFIGGSDGSWQADNIDDKLKARNIQSANGVQHVQQFTGSVGGPLIKDKIWWIIAARHQSSDQRVANVPEHFIAPDGTPPRGAPTTRTTSIRNAPIRKAAPRGFTTASTSGRKIGGTRRWPPCRTSPAVTT